MAKGPGPILALAGLGALFMMVKGGGNGGSAKGPITDPGDFLSFLDALGEEVVPADQSMTGDPQKRSLGTGFAPPNLSGDAAGYSQSLWQTPRDVRNILKMMGYAIEISDAPVYRDSAAVQFQEDYNSAALWPNPLYADGLLLVDGTMGKNELNALHTIVTRGAVGAVNENAASDWKAFRSSRSNPPSDLSNNPSGYDAQRWSDPQKLLEGLDLLGYDEPTASDPIYASALVLYPWMKPVDVTALMTVLEFQADYNKASDRGVFDAVGRVNVLGVIDKNTLNALAIIIDNVSKNPEGVYPWTLFKTVS